MAEAIISTPLASLGDDAESQSEQVQVVVDAAQHGHRADRVLALHLPGFSRVYLQGLIDEGAVTLGETVVRKPAARMRAGDILTVELRPTQQAMAFVAQPMALDVVHEDEHLLVIDKPAGLVVHPAAGHWSGTLLNGLLAYHEGASRLPRAGIVHRLDKDTSGLMLVGKTLQAVEALTAAIAARRVQRLYLAVAQGPWKHDETELTVDRPIGRDSHNRLRMAVVRPDASGGKPAQTTVQCLDANARHLLLACRLHTGRTHQIRVHMAWLGHPLVGDTLYGGRAELAMERQALHAARLALSHPVHGEALVFHRSPPTDFLQALKLAGLQYNGSNWWQALAS